MTLKNYTCNQTRPKNFDYKEMNKIEAFLHEKVNSWCSNNSEYFNLWDLIYGKNHKLHGKKHSLHGTSLEYLITNRLDGRTQNRTKVEMAKAKKAANQDAGFILCRVVEADKKRKFHTCKGTYRHYKWIK